MAFVSAKAIAEKLNVCPRTVKRWAKRFDVRTIREGQVLRFWLPDLIEALDKKSASA